MRGRFGLVFRDETRGERVVDGGHFLVHCGIGGGVSGFGVVMLEVLVFGAIFGGGGGIGPARNAGFGAYEERNVLGCL